MRTKILTFVLALLMILSCTALFSCDTGKKPPVNNQTNNNDNKNDQEEIKPDVPTEGVAGTFNVLHHTTNNHEWTNPWDEICPSTGMEIAPGDLIGDDIFDRTAWLEEQYGIIVTCEYMDYTQFPTKMPEIISSGSTDYQLLDTFGLSAQRLMGNEYFVNMADVPYINFDHPWWVESALSELRLGDYVEFAVSDMLLTDKSATMIVFYNIDMANDLHLDNIYDNVRNYEWTIEQMAEYAELAALNGENGDDVADKNDIYGLVTNDDPVHMLYVASGRKFMSRDEDGMLYYSYGTDDTFDVMIDNLNVLMYADFTWNSHLKPDAPVFAEGGALFTFDKIKRCMLIRDMKDDYGILPLPMYEEEQQKYFSPVSNYHDSMFAVINTNVDNRETIGAALELMGYYSYYNIYRDFFEVLIQNRGTRDAESKEMLGIVFENRAYDMGLIFDPHGLMDKVLRITKTGEDGVVSQWEGFRTQRDDTLERINGLIEKYN
jgi:hypothetical protein